MTDLPDVAWDSDGQWCGDGPEPPGGRPLLAVGHQACRRPDLCGTFVCLWCRRAVPWCFGAGGDAGLEGRLCDDCWCEAFGTDAASPSRPRAIDGLMLIVGLLALAGCGEQPALLGALAAATLVLLILTPVLLVVVAGRRPGRRPRAVTSWARAGEDYVLNVEWTDGVVSTFRGQGAVWHAHPGGTRCAPPLAKWLYDRWTEVRCEEQHPSEGGAP